ncbi:MAG: type II secretion system minor pseudopilin GspJ [Gammaproteobacteria bacterium]
MNSPRRQAAFTLIELLVSLAIFAILSVIAYQGLQTMLDARARIEQQATRLTELQGLFAILGRDLEQAVGRQVRDGFGDPQPALQGNGTRLELSRAGRRNPAAFRRSNLQRVAYLLAENQLLRRSWAMLDRALGSGYQEGVLAEHIQGMEFRYLDQALQWQGQWPPSIPAGQQQAVLPRAIEVTLEVEGWGKIRRLYRLPRAIDVESPAE